MAHEWRDNIKLMLNDCHNCWSYKAIKFAFEANPTKIIIYSPYRVLMKFSFVGVCPKTAPSQVYTICKYVNWIGMHGRIGDKNNYRKHNLTV